MDWIRIRIAPSEWLQRQYRAARQTRGWDFRPVISGWGGVLNSAQSPNPSSDISRMKFGAFDLSIAKHFRCKNNAFFTLIYFYLLTRVSYSFSALTLLKGWLEGHPACKNLIPDIPKSSFGTFGWLGHVSPKCMCHCQHFTDFHCKSRSHSVQKAIQYKLLSKSKLQRLTPLYSS